MGSAIVWLVNTVIDLIILLILVRAVVSWLVAFNVINLRNRAVFQIVDMLERITDPILRPFQRFVPLLGGVDVSPIVAWLVLGFIKIAFNRLLAGLLIGLFA